MINIALENEKLQLGCLFHAILQLLPMKTMAALYEANLPRAEIDGHKTSTINGTDLKSKHVGLGSVVLPFYH